MISRKAITEEMTKLLQAQFILDLRTAASAAFFLSEDPESARRYNAWRKRLIGEGFNAFSDPIITQMLINSMLQTASELMDYADAFEERLANAKEG